MDLSQLRTPNTLLIAGVAAFAILIADFLIPPRAAQQIFRALGRLLPGWPWW